MKNALVVGGTGMLKAASLWLAGRYNTAVLSRRPERLQAEGIQSIKADYTQAGFLKVVEAIGTIDLAVVWMHSTAGDIPLKLAEYLAQFNCHYYHVLGSAYYSPEQLAQNKRKAFDAVTGLHYHEVLLGYKQEGAHSRWLTNDEISEGVVAAIENQQPRDVIGQIEPWDLRP